MGLQDVLEHLTLCVKPSPGSVLSLRRGTKFKIHPG